MVQTISKRQIEEAAKEYTNQNGHTYWKDAIDIFNFMSKFLNKQKDRKLKFDENRCIVIDNEVEVILRRREYDLAHYLYNNANRVISRDELLEKVWKEVIVDDNSLAVHICNIRKKLPNAKIQTKVGLGLIWIEDDNI
jgi:DNA-binding response OmpR family regulator